MSKAPYSHSDGSDCYTKECSRGHVSVPTPVKSSFAQALALKSLERPIEVEEVTYDGDGFAVGGVLLSLCNAGAGGPIGVRTRLIEAGITERNGWEAAEGQWAAGGNFQGESDCVYMVDLENDWDAEFTTIRVGIQTYLLVNHNEKATLELYGLEDGPEVGEFTTYVTRGEAIYELWNGWEDTYFDMEGITPGELAAAVEYSSDPLLIRWVVANGWAEPQKSSPELLAAMRPGLLKMFPGHEDIPFEWLIKMVN